MKVAVVGATGMVGQVMLKVLEERNFPVTELIPVASEKSVGKKISFKGKEFGIVSMQTAVDLKPEIAIFSAGGGTSLEWAPKFAEAGSFVIDNSSAWRMDPTKKLVVPEINANELTKDDKIIANPNCSTIQVMPILKVLHEKYGLKRVIYSTYQAVAGSGQKGIDDLEANLKGESSKGYPHQIAFNLIPHIDAFLDNGYTKEEIKMIEETRKILGIPNLKVTATCVRVPVKMGHAVSINVELENSFKLEDVIKAFEEKEGVIVRDDVKNNIYPMPIEAEDTDEVYVGRIRRDESIDNGLNLWVVADNIRKGAATNTIQIAETLIKKGVL